MFIIIIVVFDKILPRSSPVSSQDFYCSLPRDQSRDVIPRMRFFLFSSLLPFAYAASFRLLLLQLGNNRCAEALVVKQKFSVGG